MPALHEPSTAVGERRPGTSFYPPAALRERLEREVLMRNVRDRVMDWGLSSVVIDILEEHFGLPRTQSDSRGR